MYTELKNAILNRDDKVVFQIQGEVSSSSNHSIESCWLMVICLVYRSYMLETDVYYKECVDLIDSALADKNSINDPLFENRLIYMRIHCVNELYSYGCEPTNQFVIDRQILFDRGVIGLQNVRDRFIDHLNSVEIFLWSSILHKLVFEKAENEQVFSFCQNLIANKILIEHYSKINCDNMKRTKKNLNALLENSKKLFVDTLFYPLFFSENLNIQQTEKSIQEKSRPRWDEVSLGINLP